MHFEKARVAASAVFVLAVALACGGKKKTETTTTTSAATTTASAAPTVSAKVDVPDPPSDYTKIDDIKMDGAKAFGKTALLHMWRGKTESDQVTLYPCGDKGGGLNWIESSFSSEKKPLVKAISTSAFGSSTSTCPRVLLKITGKTQYTNTLKGEIQQILDVEPETPEPLPPGVDFLSIDDVNLAGKSAKGKIAQFTIYRGDTQTTSFTAFPCGKNGGIQFLKVKYTSTQKDAVKDLPTHLKNCATVKLKMDDQDFGSWRADLVEILPN